MKIKSWKRKGIIGTMLVTSLVLGFSVNALALPQGIDDPAPGYCKIYNSFWDRFPYESISLRAALAMANDAKFNACKLGVTLTQAVEVQSPVVVSPQGAFVFDGAGQTIDARNIVSSDTDGQSGLVTVTNLDGSTSQVVCAVMIAGSQVKVKNLVIKVSDGLDPTKQVAGMCIKGADNKISAVTTYGGKDGIILDSGSSGNMLLPDLNLQTASDFGILDNTKGTGVNAVVMSNVATHQGDEETTDMDGMVDPSGKYFDLVVDMLADGFDFNSSQPTGTSEVRMALSGDKGLIMAKLDIIPVITSIKAISNTDRYHILGFFYKGAVTEDANGGFQPLNCSGLTPDTTIRRMGVFMVKGASRAYVGTVGKNASKGVKAKKGIFDFYIDSTKNTDLKGGSFVLVPVDDNWILKGRASNYKTLAGNQSDCQAGTVPSGLGDNVGTGNNNNGVGGLIGYDSLLQCNQDLENLNGVPDATKDSDSDGIPDFIEMGVRKETFTPKDANGNDLPAVTEYVYDPSKINCSCDDSALLSCWFKTDTDGDGIKDGRDGYIPNLDGLKSVLAAAQVLTRLQASVVDPILQPLDSNKDGIVDVKSTDSDGDGLMDGQEDRARLYNRNAPAYFMYLETVAGKYYLSSKGEKVACDLSKFDKSAKDIGIGYSLFKAGGNAGSSYIEVPVEYNMFTPPNLQDGQALFPLACINESVSSDKDFSGSYEQGRGETDARTPDTDGDCVCDGHGTGCAAIDNMNAKPPMSGQCMAIHGVSVVNAPQYLDDGCPEKQSDTNVCTSECIEHEVLGYVRDHYPEWLKDPNTAGALELKDDNSNGIPDLFEQTVDKEETVFGKTYKWKEADIQTIQKVCSDIDKDGIPDCVERWEDTCTPTAAQKAFLNPYTNDSDNDGEVDGIAQGTQKEDVCPFTHEKVTGGDAFTANNANYSCDARQVYQGNVPKILSCFLDRDGDGLRDCLEDRDMDGQLKSPVVGVDGIYASESDPLMIDTDADGMDDYKEVIGWPYRTNPALADTDGDGLDDKAEDRDADGAITLSQDRSGQGCGPAEMKLDTDPRNADTDGDGLSDGLEVKGPIVDSQNFLALIEDPTVWGQGGIPHGSNPNAKDADGDNLTDGQEYNGSAITYYDSNSCMMDSDGDSINDADEFVGCALNKDPNCKGTGEKQSEAAKNGTKKDTSGGIDSDSDGLPDAIEHMLGTDPNNPDTDGDGVKDGDEDTNHNGIYEPNLGETNPLDPDTDHDGLNDGMELRYGTDPTNMDTDGDCIPDGVEDANHNGQFDTGAETNALSADTDGDSLPDGNIGGLGEDLNCNGTRDKDPATGNWLETDPRLYDSDFDGENDYDEMSHGGSFNISNLGRATQGQSGCSMIPNATSTVDPMSGILTLVGMLLLAVVRPMAGRMRKTPA